MRKEKNKIKRVVWDWTYTNSQGEEKKEAIVGRMEVTDIQEIKGSAKEPYHILIRYKRNKIKKIFNINEIETEEGD